jgi:hypothetical protein
MQFASVYEHAIRIKQNCFDHIFLQPRKIAGSILIRNGWQDGKKVEGGAMAALRCAWSR